MEIENLEREADAGTAVPLHIINEHWDRRLETGTRICLSVRPLSFFVSGLFAFITDYAEVYDKESFTQGTLGECDFIESEIGGDRSVAILDIGCGTGRHAIELARRGCKVTGIDLSRSQIERARAKAAAAGVAPDFRVGDARALPFGPEFGLALMICEGAFPLMETVRMRSRLKTRDNFGRPIELDCDERWYLPSELSWLLKQAGLASIEIFGARLGAFSRMDALTPDDFEMLAVSVKP